MYPTRPGRLYPMLAGAALIVLLVAQQQQLLTLPGSGRVATALPDALHGSWFVCVTWCVLMFTSKRFHGVAAIIVTVAIGVALAVGTELLQKLTGGDAEIGDIVFDMLGMAAALFSWAAHQRLIPPAAGGGAAAVLWFATLWPLVPALMIDRYRDSIAPDLVRFDSPHVWDLLRSDSSVEIAAPPSGWTIAGPVLRITLADEVYPGVSIVDPIDDWSRYTQLDVDGFVPGPEPMPVTISIRIDHADVDHVYRTFACGPGPCRLRLPLEALFDRAVSRVNAVVIYSNRAQAGRVLYLGRVALER